MGRTVRLPDLREQHAEHTRERIMDAVVRIMARGVAELSVQAVSRESGVSRPTVYRYFKNKAEMIDAVGRLYGEKIGVTEGQPGRTLDGLLDMVQQVFARSESLDDVLRAAVWSRQGQPLRSGVRRERRLEDTRRLVADECPDLAKKDREQLARIIVVLCSSSTQRAFQDYLGLGAEEAAECVTWTIRRLTRRGK